LGDGSFQFYASHTCQLLEVGTGRGGAGAGVLIRDGSGISVRRFSGAFRRMATPLWSRLNRVGAKSFGVTVKRVSPKVFVPGGNCIFLATFS
jgi:3-methyladenine DNA glycosylase Mpg